MSDVLVTIYAKLPTQPDPQPIPVLYKDLNGDGSAYAPIVTTSAGGGGVALGNATYTEKTVTETVSTIVAANPNRKSLLIRNNSLVDEIYINTATPAANGGSLKIAAGASYTTDVTGNAFKAIAAASKTVSITIEEIA